jgi:hypothetical protein
MRNRKPIILTPRGEMVVAISLMLLLGFLVLLCGAVETLI